jgi:hypothetical protein
VGSGATLLAYLLIVLTWRAYDLSYDLVYWVAGGVTVAIALVCFFAFPQFESPNPQTKKMVLRNATGFTTRCSSCRARGGRSSSFSPPS